MPHYVLDARTATPHFPGIGRYVRSLARAMVAQLAEGETLTLLVDPKYPPQIEGAREVPLAASPFSLSQQWAVPRALRSLGADLYHSAYYLMPYLPGIPSLLTVYDLIPLRHPEHSSARAHLLYRLANALALRTAGHALAISEHARQDYLAEFGMAPGRISAVHLAADPMYAPQPAAAVAELRTRLDLPGRYLLYVGSSKPHKNLARAVSAWGRTARDLTGDEAFVIAGARDPKSEAEAIAAGTGNRVRWLGHVADADLPALYTGATAFIFPSLYEGFGLPVLEAMACGTPVLCSERSSLPEVAGGAALLTDPTDLSALAGSIVSIMCDADLRRTLSEAGLERASQFSWERTAAATLAHYRRMVGRS